MTESSQQGVRYRTYLSGGIPRNARVELSLANQVQEVIRLVNGQNCWGGIIYSRREGLDGDIHEDPEPEGRVVLHGALGTQHDNGATKRAATILAIGGTHNEDRRKALKRLRRIQVMDAFSAEI